MNNLKSLLGKIYRKYAHYSGLQKERSGIGIVKTPFTKKGYLKRSFSQQGEDLTLDRIWSRIFNYKFNTNGIYVDIGAYRPLEHSVTYLMYLRGWRGLVIDASPKSCDLHKKHRPRDIVINAVVGRSDLENVDFYYHQAGELSLINTKYPDDSNSYNKVSLPQKNINTILDSANITKIDFLNIDIEGAELEVLETLNFDKYKPKIIAVEIHGNNIVKGIDNDVSKILFNKEYKLVGVNVITYFFCRPD